MLLLYYGPVQTKNVTQYTQTKTTVLCRARAAQALYIPKKDLYKQKIMYPGTRKKCKQYVALFALILTLTLGPVQNMPIVVFIIRQFFNKYGFSAKRLIWTVNQLIEYRDVIVVV
jgi:hypothetical protein